MNFNTPPYLSQNASVQRVMLQVLAALLPGIAVYAWLIGPVVLVQVAIATLAALAGEAPGKANAAFVREVTGYAIGGVPPMAHAQAMTVFIDEDLMAEETVWAAAGTPNSMFPLTPDLLVRLAGGRVADVKAEPAPASYSI